MKRVREEHESRGIATREVARGDAEGQERIVMTGRGGTRTAGAGTLDA